jgi:hypothetical protein
MDSMWNIDCEIQDIKPANELIQIQCEKLAEITNNKVLARISEYKEEDFRSHTIVPELKGFHFLDEKVIDPQDSLGEKGENDEFVYEFYITSKKTPKYKYRICFIYFSITLYPVGLTIDKSIADSAGLEYTELDIEAEDDFEQILSEILGCKKVAKIIQNLLSINKESIF